MSLGLRSVGVDMSELEIVEREYRQLQTRLIYGDFNLRKADPNEELRFKELANRRVELSAPDMVAAA